MELDKSRQIFNIPKHQPVKVQGGSSSEIFSQQSFITFVQVINRSIYGFWPSLLISRNGDMARKSRARSICPGAGGGDAERTIFVLLWHLQLPLLREERVSQKGSRDKHGKGAGMVRGCQALKTQ